MLAINQETTARENFEYLKKSSFDSNEESKNFTTSSLNVQARLKKCVFSKYEDPYSDQCKIVTNQRKYEKRNFEERKHLLQMFKARTHKEKLSN